MKIRKLVVGEATSCCRMEPSAAIINVSAAKSERRHTSRLNNTIYSIIHKNLGPDASEVRGSPAPGSTKPATIPE